MPAVAQYFDIYTHTHQGSETLYILHVYRQVEKHAEWNDNELYAENKKPC